MNLFPYHINSQFAVCAVAMKFMGWIAHFSWNLKFDLARLKYYWFSLTSWLTTAVSHSTLQGQLVIMTAMLLPLLTPPHPLFLVHHLTSDDVIITTMLLFLNPHCYKINYNSKQLTLIMHAWGEIPSWLHKVLAKEPCMLFAKVVVTQLVPSTYMWQCTELIRLHKPQWN